MYAGHMVQHVLLAGEPLGTVLARYTDTPVMYIHVLLQTACIVEALVTLRTAYTVLVQVDTLMLAQAVLRLVPFTTTRALVLPTVAAVG